MKKQCMRGDEGQIELKNAVVVSVEMIKGKSRLWSAPGGEGCVVSMVRERQSALQHSWKHL